MISRNGRSALLAVACAAALSGPAAAETLAEAIALAYQTNPVLRAQRAQLRALDEGVIQARAGYAPRVNLDVNASVTDSLDGQPRRNFLGRNVGEIDTGVDQVQGRLSVNQPVYTGGRVAAAVQSARADTLSGREQLRTVETNVLLSVIQAYIDIRRDQEALRIRGQNVEVLQRQFQETTARFEVGEITRTDVAQAEQRLAASQANLALAQAALANSRARYASVVGQNPGELAPEPPLPPLPATVAEAYAIAEAENPAIRAAEFVERGARARTRAARAQSAPSLSLQGSATASQSPIGVNVLGGGADEVDDQFTVALGATVPIFTGGLNASRVRQSLEQENQARFQTEDRRRTALNNVAQAWNALIGARASVLANEEQVRAANVAYEGVRAEAEVGLRTTLDVLNAQQELRNAELLLVGARRDAYLAEAQVLAAMGRLEAPNLIAGVPIYDPTYTVQRRGLRDGVLPYEPLIERIDSITVPSVELANRTTVPVTEAPLDPTAEWSPKNVPVVAPAPPPPPAAGPVAYPVTASPVRPQADAPKPDTASKLVRQPRVR